VWVCLLFINVWVARIKNLVMPWCHNVVVSRVTKEHHSKLFHLNCLHKKRKSALHGTARKPAPEIVQGVSEKSSPLKLFVIFSLRLSLFAWNFANLLAVHIHIIFSNFCRFILYISSNGVNFSTSTHRFHPVKFWVGLFTQKMKCSFSAWRHFFPHRVSQCPIIVNNR